MEPIEVIIVALAVLAAAAYLLRTWRRQLARRGGGCGCGQKAGCPVRAQKPGQG